MATDPDKLEAEARADWASRGFKDEDFDMDKLMTIWAQEGADAAGTFDELAEYKEKMDAIQNAIDARWDIPGAARSFAVGVKQLGGEISDATRASAADAWLSTKRAVELPFFRRLRLRREAEAERARVAEEERIAREAAEEAERLKQERRLMNRAIKQARAAALKDSEPHREVVRTLIQKAADDARMKRLNDARARFAEEHERFDREQREKQRAHRQYIATTLEQKRAASSLGWAKLAAENAVKAEEIAIDIAQERIARAETERQTFSKETQDMASKHLADEHPVIDISSSAPGTTLFATPLARGEFASAFDGGHKPGVDDHDVRIFSAPPAARAVNYEIRMAEVHKLESRAQMVQDALEVKQREIESLQEEAATWQETTAKLNTDLALIEDEERKLQISLDGPPQRRATRLEILSSHNRKSKRVKMVKQRDEMAQRLQEIDAAVQSGTLMSQQLASRLKSLRDDIASRRAQLDQEHQEYAALPMVVGTRLDTVLHDESLQITPLEEARAAISSPAKTGTSTALVPAAGGSTAITSPSKASAIVVPPKTVPRPVEAQAPEIVLGSKLEITKVSAKELDLMRRDIGRTELQQWQLEAERRNVAHDLEQTKSRLVAIQDELRASEQTALRTEMIGALRRFFANGEKLRSVNHLRVGVIDWMTVQTKVERVEPWDGIRDVKSGVRLRLPKGTAGKRVKFMSQSLLTARPGTTAERVDLRTGAPGKVGRMVPWDGAVRLGRAKTGVIEGVVPLPTLALWLITIVVTKPNPSQVTRTDRLAYGQVPATSVGGDPNDHVLLYVGNTLRSVTPIGKICNNRAPGRPDVLYKIQFKQYGHDFAFRFVFNSTETSTKHHLCVLSGQYEEQRLPPLTVLGEGHVISDYVILQRMVTNQGQERAAALLTELVRVESTIEYEAKQAADAKKAEAEAAAKRERKRLRAKRAGKPVKSWDLDPPKKPWRGADARTRMVLTKALHPGIEQQFERQNFLEVFQAELEEESDKLLALTRAAADEKLKKEEEERAERERNMWVNTADTATATTGTGPSSPTSPARSPSRGVSAPTSMIDEGDGFEPQADAAVPTVDPDAKLPSRPPSAAPERAHSVSFVTSAEEHFPPLEPSALVALQQKYRVSESEKAYLSRKRLGQDVNMDAARNYVGRRVEIWDEQLGLWRQAEVEDVRAEWRNNDTTLVILHKLRYVDFSRMAARHVTKWKFKFSHRRMRLYMGDVVDSHGVEPDSASESDTEEEGDDAAASVGGDAAKPPVSTTDIVVATSEAPAGASAGEAAAAGTTVAAPAAIADAAAGGPTSGAPGTAIIAAPGAPTTSTAIVPHTLDDSDGLESEAEDTGPQGPPRRKARGDLFAGVVWQDLSVVKHHLMTGEAARVEELRIAIQKEMEAQARRVAEREYYENMEVKEFWRMQALIRDKTLAKLQRKRDRQMDELQRSVTAEYEAKIRAIKENQQADPALWSYFELEAQRVLREYRQGWKQEAAEAALQRVGAAAENREFMTNGVIKDSNALFEVQDLKSMEADAEGMDTKAAMAAAAERRKYQRQYTIEEARFHVQKAYVNDKVKDALILENLKWEIRVQREKNRLKREEWERQQSRARRLVRRLKMQKEAAVQKGHGLDQLRIELRKRMVIPNFEKAIADRAGIKCAHEHVRYWGHQYGKGLRCLDCGEELSDVNNIRRLLTDDLDRAAQAHEADTDGRLLYGSVNVMAVEQERLRVEKERFMVEMADIQFADYVHTKLVRQADTRHALKEFHQENADEEAPLARRRDMAKRAMFHDSLEYIGRMRNFNYRLTELSDEREDLSGDKTVATTQMAYLYHLSAALEKRIRVVDKEHDRALEKVMIMDDAIEKQDRASEALKKARADLAAAQADADRLVRESMLARQAAEKVEANVEDMMRWWKYAVKEQEEASKTITTRRADRERVFSKFANARRLLQGVQWQTQGMRVLTRYGPCKVIDFREKDHMVTLQPLWSARPTTAFIIMPIVTIVAVEDAREEIERVQIVVEDKISSDVQRLDRAIMERELAAMRREEEDLQLWHRFLRSVDQEKAELVIAAAAAAQRAQAEVKTDRMQAEFLRKAELQVEETIVRMQLARDIWLLEKKGLKPKLIGWYGKRKLLQYLFQKAQTDYIEAEVAASATQVAIKWQKIRDDMIVSDVQRDRYYELVADMLLEVAERALADGLAAKERSEEEGGWVVSEAHLQYVVYRTLYSLWGAQKEALKCRIRRWILAQESERDTSDESSGNSASSDSDSQDTRSSDEAGDANDDAATGQDEWRALLQGSSGEDADDDWVVKAAKEEWVERGLPLEQFSMRKLQDIKVQEASVLFKERTLAKATRRAMEHDEHATKLFYKLELRMCLRERWAMAEEDAAMRALMAMEKSLGMKSQGGAKGKSVMSNKLARRADLKKTVVERNKRRRETEGMEAEDVLSRMMRDEFLREQRLREQRERMAEAERLRREAEEEAAFGLDSDSDSDAGAHDADDDDDDEDSSAGSSSARDDGSDDESGSMHSARLQEQIDVVLDSIRGSCHGGLHHAIGLDAVLPPPPEAVPPNKDGEPAPAEVVAAQGQVHVSTATLFLTGDSADLNAEAFHGMQDAIQAALAAVHEGEAPMAKVVPPPVSRAVIRRERRRQRAILKHRAKLAKAVEVAENPTPWGLAPIAPKFIPFEQRQAAAQAKPPPPVFTPWQTLYSLPIPLLQAGDASGGRVPVSVAGAAAGSAAAAASVSSTPSKSSATASPNTTPAPVAGAKASPKPTVAAAARSEESDAQDSKADAKGAKDGKRQVRRPRQFLRRKSSVEKDKAAEAAAKAAEEAAQLNVPNQPAWSFMYLLPSPFAKVPMSPQQAWVPPVPEEEWPRNPPPPEPDAQELLLSGTAHLDSKNSKGSRTKSPTRGSRSLSPVKGAKLQRAVSMSPAHAKLWAPREPDGPPPPEPQDRFVIRRIFGPALVVQGAVTFQTTPVKAAPLPRRTIPLPAGSLAVLRETEEAKESPFRVGTLARRFSKLFDRETFGMSAVERRMKEAQVNAMEARKPSHVRAHDAAAKAAAARLELEAAVGDGVHPSARYGDIVPVPLLRTVGRLAVPMLRVVPFGPWLGLGMGPREWRCRMRRGEETPEQTVEREEGEMAAFGRRMATAERNRAAEALAVDLVLKPRRPWSMLSKFAPVLRYNEVVRPTQDNADASRKKVIAYLNEQAAKRAEKRNKLREVRRAERARIKEATRLRRAGILSLNDVPAGQEAYNRLREDTEFLAAPIVLPQNVSRGYMAAVVEHLGGCETVIAKWDQLQEGTEDESTLLAHAASDPQQRMKLLEQRRIRLVKRCILRVTQLEEENRRLNAARERQKQKKIVKARLSAKRRLLVGGPPPKPKGVQLDKFAVALEKRAERLAGKSARAELTLVLAEEDMRQAEKRHRRATYNADQVCKRTQLKAAEAQRLRKMSDETEVALQKAREHHMNMALLVSERAAIEEQTSAHLKEMIALHEFIDSEVLHNKPQRFETRDLEKRLHWYYFQTVVEDVATRAEAIGCERTARQLSEQIRANVIIAQEKKVQLAKLSKKFLRHTRLRMKRSALGQMMFSKSRRRVLQGGFAAIKAYMIWHKTSRENFEIQYAVKHQDINLHRAEADRRLAAEHRLHGATRMDASGTMPGALGNEGNSLLPAIPRTVMSTFHSRWLKCRFCHHKYTPQGNHALACEYHPGSFEMSCPRSCLKFTSTCMNHFRNRWTCCDSVVPSSDGTGGCARRWHEPDDEPELRDNATKVAVAVAEHELAVAQQHREVQKAEEEARLAGMDQRNAIAARTAQLRSEVELFRRLKKN